MFHGDERHCPGLTGEQAVYEDYALYAKTVANIEPLPFEEWMFKTQSAQQTIAPHRER